MTAAAQILELAQEHRAGTSGSISHVALGTITDPRLRNAMIANPRLGGQLRARLEKGGALALPDQLVEFDGDAALCQLLSGDLDTTRQGLGLAWFANVLSPALMRGDPLPINVSRVTIRWALTLRAFAPALSQTGRDLPDTDDVMRAGRLCLAAWCGALSDVPAMIALELGAMDHTDMREAAAESTDIRARRRQLTNRWLDAVRQAEVPA
ncbi:hypothetical protein [Yoonia maritima]|uniref:hypothetical protein n=1 Tax=Yoonia maritima TaxID=1435347 RepID=UPI000D0F4861|nr:hypothetical protein [Yoonia maritima]